MADAVLVYDDDCGFCTWWAEFFARRSDLRIVGFSDLTPVLRVRLPENYEDCSHLVTDEGVYSCGASIEEAFVRSDLGERARPLIERVREFEGYGTLREGAYRWVADNRDLWGELLSKTPPARESDGEN
jgi:predicted DCC family thiol-disulfide oxidoreductase YuxK